VRRVFAFFRFYKAHIFSTIVMAVIIAIVIALNVRSSEPDNFKQGVITGFRLVEGEFGTVTMAFVRLQNSQTVVVRATPLLRCKVGSTVSVREAHSLLGSQYSLAPFQCLNAE
jgi:maltooligosyltrehalose synthase